MEGRHRQKPSQLVLQPPAGMDGLAARAVPVAAAQRNAFTLAAVGAFIDRVAERAGPAKSHALENAFFARRQMRARRQKAGEESAQPPLSPPGSGAAGKRGSSKPRSL